MQSDRPLVMCTNAGSIYNNQLRDNKHSNGIFSPSFDHSQQVGRDERGCAFDNPYFRDESYAINQNFMRQLKASNAQELHESSVEQQQQQLSAGKLHESAGNEQLHFIEHHISNLHNRQVTSSVQELSILGELH